MPKGHQLALCATVLNMVTCSVNDPYVFWLLSDCVCPTTLSSWPQGISCNISCFPMSFFHLFCLSILCEPGNISFRITFYVCSRIYFLFFNSTRQVLILSELTCQVEDFNEIWLTERPWLRDKLVVWIRDSQH